LEKLIVKTYLSKDTSFFPPDFELYWPRGGRVARVIEGGEIAGINGFMHMVEDVLIYEPDLRAHGGFVEVLSWQLALVLTFMFWRPGVA
ncbi:hypothetical protein NECAME_18558, partial [Necator americanus]